MACTINHARHPLIPAKTCACVMGVKQRILVVGLLVCLLLVSGVVTNIVLEAVYHPGQTRAETPALPESEAALLHTLIEAEFLHPGVLQKTVTEQAIAEETAAWTTYDYTIHVERQGVFSEIAYALSEAVPANGGKIFQTHFQPDGHKASIAIGIDTLITHTIAVTWDALPQETPVPVQERPTGKYLAAIVIDDLGASDYAVQRLLNMGADFTFSVLPHLDKSTAIATWLHNQQKEILLHLPMEPQGYEYPGKGAILMTMTADEIQRTIHDNLRTVPFAAGVNNHMGSRLTGNVEKMEAVLQTLQQQNLFFLDSRTSGRTIAYRTAQQLGLRSAERKVFIDSIPGYDFAKSQLQELAALAERGQPAIAIGHPKDATLRALEDMLPEFEQRNIEIIRLSQFVE